MKKYLFIIVGIICLPVLFSCNKRGESKNVLPDATGAPYELIAVVPQQEWESALGDTLTAIFAEPVEYINEYCPVFDMMRIASSSFKDFLRKHRNVITVNVNPELSESGSAVVYDRYSSPQLVVSVYGPDEESLMKYISENRETLITVFEEAERDRALEGAKKFSEKNLMKMVEDMFGIKMNIPRGYSLKGTLKSGDMIVFSYEYPLASQGVAIYSYPYTGESDFEKENIVRMRNKFMANIPGPSENSYMTTSTAFDPDIIYKTINGRPWAEARGFWEVENDYMGGPFVSYSTLDVDNKRVIVLDCYVYSPRDSKRNKLRALEHLVYSVEFPGDKVVVESGK